MANAGNHNDTRLIKTMIIEGKLLKIIPQDHPVARIIKERFNDIVTNDHIENRSYNGKKYLSHSAWNRVGKTLIWVNQLRIKHRFFDTIK